IVTASAARCCSFMLKIASRIERRVPAARRAAKDDPYSTIRRSSRWYQTRCGMWWTSGCAPVTIDERQTGVSDGNVDVARPYSPCSARNRSAGAWLSRAASKVKAVRPSMTTRMTFLVAGKYPKPGVALAAATSQPCAEGRQGHRFEVADAWDQRERGH